MSIFNLIKKKESTSVVAPPGNGNASALATLVLNSIDEGVVIVLPNGTVEFVNPAVVSMLGATDAHTLQNVQLSSVLNLENGEGMKIEDKNNPILGAVNTGENYTTRDLVLVSMHGQRHPVAITVTSVKSGQNERIITLRGIAKELEEEGEQTEFISTASHEMRTPVASIEGYLGLALNPKTATIDERARKYLEEAHASSKHLGKLFKDLLDVTKMDDKKIKVHLLPIEVTSTIRSIVNGQVPQMGEKGIHYTFGASGANKEFSSRVLNQEVYANLDVDFLREAINNLVENAIKYTKSGGGIWVNVRGDGDRVLINITDTGIGIAPDDLKHVFQKFYRADNSQTRTVGGTGLGLYIVKQRIEAIGGKVWAESSFGEGSTFYLSFPRITAEEYQRRKQIISNIETMTPDGNINSVNTIVQTPDENTNDVNTVMQTPDGNINNGDIGVQQPQQVQLSTSSQPAELSQAQATPSQSQFMPVQPQPVQEVQQTQTTQILQSQPVASQQTQQSQQPQQVQSQTLRQPVSGQSKAVASPTSITTSSPNSVSVAFSTPEATSAPIVTSSGLTQNQANTQFSPVSPNNNLN